MIIGYIGKPRSGKSTALATYVAKNIRNKKINKFLHFKLFHEYSVIYSTEYLIDTVHIEPYDIGTFLPQENSLIIIGEAGICFNNRNFKFVPEHCTSFFALHGHYHTDIVWDSQTVDVDRKLRNRTHYLYLVEKSHIWKNVSWLKFINYGVTVNNDSHDLVEGYSIGSGLWKVLGYLCFKNKMLYRRPYYKFFDSYCKPLKFTKRDPALPKEVKPCTTIITPTKS